MQNTVIQKPCHFAYSLTNYSEQGTPFLKNCLTPLKVFFLVPSLFQHFIQSIINQIYIKKICKQIITLLLEFYFHSRSIMEESTNLWVFGYGSLVWKPGFQHGKILVGKVQGFARRFWQGNETHRGVPGKPGRVATLIEEQGVETYGVAMELTGDEALDYLNNREMTLGGYIQKITLFHTADSKHAPFPVLVFVATPKSSYWLGPAESHVIAEQVIGSSGPSGEYCQRILILLCIHIRCRSEFVEGITDLIGLRSSSYRRTKSKSST